MRTTTESFTVTTARVAAIPPRSTDSRSRAHPPNGQPLEEGRHLVEIRPGIEQAAQGHVAGDAGEAVEPGHRAGAVGDAHGRVRATAQAAPNPLSMPTTVIPAAQEACMANSAVTPSRAAP